MRKEDNLTKCSLVSTSSSHVNVQFQRTFKVIIRVLISTVTYSLIPWSRVPLEKLTGSLLVKKFAAFYGNRRFITTFESARHMSLSRARTTQSMLSRRPPEDQFDCCCYLGHLFLSPEGPIKMALKLHNIFFPT